MKFRGTLPEHFPPQVDGPGLNWQEAAGRIGQPHVHHHNHHNSLPKPTKMSC